MAWSRVLNLPNIKMTKTEPIVQNATLTDQAGHVRPGEEIDVRSLSDWLASTSLDLQGLPIVTQYSGGVSNWTYCLSFENREVILRRGPDGSKAKGAHDMGREYRLQKAIKPVYRYVPEMLAYCDDKNVIGAEFYLMEKINGVIARRNFPKSVTPDPQTAQTLCHNLLDALVELHQVDYKAAGLEHLAKGAGYIRRQIEGWNERYVRARTWNVPSGRFIRNWLENNMPKQENICLTHNDFRFDNAVLDPDNLTNIIGILDWELATLGDPLMDLGNMLAYWVNRDDGFFGQAIRRQPTHLEGMLSRRQVIDYYCKKRNIEVDDFTFYEVYGLFRLSVIAQQIYYRYHHKQTRNPAYKHFWLFVHYMHRRCKQAIRARGKNR